jgi:serine/threonine protein kinase
MFIDSLIVLDPSKRLTLDQIMLHPFMQQRVPDKLPVEFLTTAPTEQYVWNLQNNLDFKADKPIESQNEPSQPTFTIKSQPSKILEHRQTLKNLNLQAPITP